MARWSQLFVLAMLAACSSGASDQSDVPDASTPDVNVPDFICPGCDTSPVDSGGTDLQPADTTVPDGDGGPSCHADFTPCDANKDCCSGWCLPDPDGHRMCTIECVDSCPDGWECTGTSFGGDFVFLCFAEEKTLCHKPCAVDLDCGSGEHLCAEVAEANFCLQDCSNG